MDDEEEKMTMLRTGRSIISSRYEPVFVKRNTGI